MRILRDVEQELSIDRQGRSFAQTFSGLVVDLIGDGIELLRALVVRHGLAPSTKHQAPRVRPQPANGSYRCTAAIDSDDQSAGTGRTPAPTSDSHCLAHTGATSKRHRSRTADGQWPACNPMRPLAPCPLQPQRLELAVERALADTEHCGKFGAAALVRGYPLAQRCSLQFTQGRARHTRR